MFVTTNTAKRHPVFLDPVMARIAVDTMYTTQQRYPFFLHAFVIMPDHCHFLLTPPEGGSVSRIIHVYKRGVSFEIGKGPIWQKRFDCRLIEQPSKVIRYIHGNPVAAGLCEHPHDYLWSSACGKWDVCSLDWAGGFV
jgi:REP element-mobilizing transposase RayT